MNTNLEWDWEKMISSMDYHLIASRGWVGWDMIGGSPNHIYLEVVHKKSRSSHDIAVEWDDISEKRFYYRDITSNALPFVGDGDLYSSVFVFESEKDCKSFYKRFL